MLDKEKLVYRILSGRTKINVNNKTYFVKGANAHQKYLAEEIYSELCEEYYELMSDENLMDWLIENDYWSTQEEEKLGQFKKEIEEFQVKLFELGLRGQEKITTKKCIAHARDRIKELSNKRHAFDFLSAKGAALIEKNKYLIGLGLTNSKGKPILTEFNYLRGKFPLFDRIVVEYNRKVIKIGEYREIARTEPWRQYWSAKEATSSIFDVPATYLTDEQLTLISWTRLYDNVFQHPKCPSDEVIEDDDMLDGFLIKDKRDRDKEKLKETAEDLIKNPKIKSAQEVFMMADTPEYRTGEYELPMVMSPDEINNLNDESVKATKRQRDGFIEKHGNVKEAQLPDVKKKLQMAINQAKFSKGI